MTRMWSAHPGHDTKLFERYTESVYDFKLIVAGRIPC